MTKRSDATVDDLCIVVLALRDRIEEVQAELDRYKARAERAEKVSATLKDTTNDQ